MIHFLFRISSSARSEVRADGKAVHVTVVNLFQENTTETEMSVATKINETIENNLSDITSYTSK